MSIYSPNTAKFDGSARALTEEELNHMAPSIFATVPHESRSERFRPIPTIEVLRGLQREGFQPVGAKQSRTRDASKRDFTKHMIRLRRLDGGGDVRVNDTVCEILLKNANDGTSAYELMAGLFRIVCLNSLVAQTSSLDSVRVRHTGDVQSDVIEGSYRVLGEAKKALAAPDMWSSINLNDDEQQAFADAARTLRFGDSEGNVDTPITAEQLLRPRRGEDSKKDLWTTFNVVQENAMKGGLRGVRRDARNRPRRITTRQIKGIDQDVKLNRAMWQLSERMAELKTGHAID